MFIVAGEDPERCYGELVGRVMNSSRGFVAESQRDYESSWRTEIHVDAAISIDDRVGHDLEGLMVDIEPSTDRRHETHGCPSIAHVLERQVALRRQFVVGVSADRPV